MPSAPLVSPLSLLSPYAKILHFLQTRPSSATVPAPFVNPGALVVLSSTPGDLMSKARPYKPGTTWFVTRRTCLGTFRFVPKRAINAVFTFALALAAVITGVKIHAFSVMPNHAHMVVTDHETKARLPDFLRIYHSLVALALGRIQRTPGPVWDSRGPDLKILVGPKTILNKIGYTLTNPVAANLCRNPESWYGAMSAIDAMGAGPRAQKRPRRFAAAVTTIKARYDLTLTIPKAFGDISPEDYRRLVREHVQARAARINAGRRGRVLNKTMIQTRDPFDRPTGDPSSKRPDQSGRPRAYRHIECDPELRDEALAELLGFRLAYRDAYERWRNGHHDVVFPCGTWAVVQYHGARAPG